MINRIVALGEMIGDFSDTETYETKKAFLAQLTILPKWNDKPKHENENYALAIDFDLEKETFDIKLDKELSESNRDYFFAFRGADFGKNAKRVSLAFDNLKYLDNIIPDIMSESLEYSEINVFAKKILETFYYKTEKKDNKGKLKIEYTFNTKLLNEEFGEAEDIKQLYKIIQKKKNISDLTKLNTIYIMKINGMNIFDMEPKLYQQYISMLFKKRVANYIGKLGKQKETCYICGKKDYLLNKTIPIWNYYATSDTKKLFFQKSNPGKNSTYSFGICPLCIKSIMVGQSYIEDYLSGKIFDIETYIIPDIDEKKDQRKSINKLVYFLKQIITKNISYKEILDQLESMLTKSKRKNILFDFMFYENDQNACHIHKLISNVELNSLINIYKAFDDYYQIKYRLDLLSEYHSLNLSFLRNSLFYNYLSKPKVKPEHYRTELLEFLDLFLHQRKIDMKWMIKSFIEIGHHLFHNHEDKKKDQYDDYKIFGEFDSFSPFKIILIMQAFIDLGMLKYKSNPKEEIKMLTKPPKDFEEFFVAHPEIYENAPDKQGLFLLGVMISRIIYAQKDKASTFMKKINFQGIQPRRVQNLLLQVKEYSEIYKKDIYDEGIIWGTITERLQGIEDSRLSAEETVFYILTGISYAKYIGLMNAKNKEGDKDGDN